jgi:hypothetical protein
MRALVARFSRKLGREIRLGAVPRLIVKVIGAFVPLVGLTGPQSTCQLSAWTERSDPEVNANGCRSGTAVLQQGQMFGLLESDDPVRCLKILSRNLERKAATFSDGTQTTGFEGFDSGQSHWADVVDTTFQRQAPR